MQAQNHNLQFLNGSDDISRNSGDIFQSIIFMRLSAWEECRRSTTLSGDVSCCGQIFRRFRLKSSPQATLDFWHRGFQVSTKTASDFLTLLKSTRPVSLQELVPVADILGPVSGFVRLSANDNPEKSSLMPVEFQCAEVQELAYKKVLVMYWSDTGRDRSFISVFIDAGSDGTKVDEVHFSAPSEVMEETSSAFAEILDSIQWNMVTPPPVPGLTSPIMI
ncbi:MAG: hypothetical protein K8F91_22660 [Candidatus Obscuribacterales bacterium]|nr:hypothetical protein [Candidatus Obscuribacterales bacterium]